MGGLVGVKYAQVLSFPISNAINLPFTDAILDQLTADQLDAVIATYGTVSTWLTQVGDYLSEALNYIVTDDIKC
jgi:hypothetical protein